MPHVTPATARPFALLAQWGGLGLAATYAANALTRADAHVPVTGVVPAQAQAAGSGQFLPQHTSGTFSFQGLEGTDRLTSRLGVIVTWLVVALIGYAIQRQARVFGATGPAWLLARSRCTTTLAIAVAALGFAPQAGTAIASSTVLQAAGSPAALSPHFTLEPGWIAAGLGYAVLVAAAPRAWARAAVSGHASSGTGRTSTRP